MSEILPVVHPLRPGGGRGPRAWLFDLVVPGRALAWGRLTSPRRCGRVRWRADGSAFRCPGRALDPSGRCGRCAEAVRQPHDFGPAFERLARTMGEPGKVTADAFVPAQFDGWWQP